MKTLRLFALLSFLLIFVAGSSLATMHLVPTQYSSIQDAIDAAVTGDTVLVDPGTYLEHINFLGKDIFVTSQYRFTRDTSNVANTIIDAFHDGSCVKMVSGETQAAVLMGFTLINGHGSLYEPGYGTFYVGGGVYIIDSSPTIQYNMIQENNVPDGGGGIFCDGGNPIIQFNLIRNNESTVLSGCGAGMLIKNTDGAYIAHNYVLYNHSNFGAGISLKHAGPEITRNVVAFNTADYACGGIRIYDESNPSIINNTISHNSAMGIGGAIQLQDNSAPVIMNNIISYTQCGGGIAVIGSGFPDISYNLFYENIGGDYINCLPGIGDITGDPAYIGGDPYDYHLTSTSAAIDAGNPNPIYNDPDGTRNDCGAFPYDQGNPEPVVLTAFCASVTQDGVLLTWHTASEIQCYAWAVQRSHDQSDFVDISPLIPGYGTTVEPHDYSFLDQSAQTGQSYNYRLKQVDVGGAVTYSDPITVTFVAYFAADYSLKPNYPNPFNPETTLNYTLPEAASVHLAVYNTSGKLVQALVVGRQEAGLHTITWNADGLPSGNYICRLVANGQSLARILTLLK